MKTLLILFFSLFLLLSCRHTNPSQATDQDDMEEFVDTTPQATAIFWVDKIKSKRTKREDFAVSARNVKVKVDIDSAGKVEILSYVKSQDKHVRKYLQHRLDIFRVTKIMLDSGFVKSGVQYVQLKYVPERMQKYR